MTQIRHDNLGTRREVGKNFYSIPTKCSELHYFSLWYEDRSTPEEDEYFSFIFTHDVNTREWKCKIIEYVRRTLYCEKHFYCLSEETSSFRNRYTSGVEEIGIRNARYRNDGSSKSIFISSYFDSISSSEIEGNIRLNIHSHLGCI